jgi:hypothetical protein
VSPAEIPEELQFEGFTGDDVSRTFFENVFNKILSGETEGFVRPPAASLEHPLPSALGEFRDAPLLESRIACHATTDALAFWMSS